ncbi:class I SAM-dependent DNA methyltransferase [Tepidibacter hydrothermalis]|uniref:Class I SAM-dependent methyltransferase n=1 Tax=Tepidibacter hydrothermalis TaxID=3036126 RepID=A0ABY8EFB6_9FIRM|nr:class I SAM-dependent methyltransferase [Tepidibacter hydrothermalis]WFD10540.1 class I SAM-dependent methyltransferase [Tepidibacter hydrothermalis]
MCSKQNIYDNETFFNGYKALRADSVNYNILLEQPIFRKLLPDLIDRYVLDVGCGMGDSCIFYEKIGAKKVIGIDISNKMISEARRRTNSEMIKYYNTDMCDIEKLETRFDVITSSLAVHYIQDFDSLLKSVYHSLNSGGYFIFSQEHPLTTAPLQGVEYTYNENGDVIHYNLSDYMYSGIRKVEWFVDDVIVYHRPISEIINLLIQNNFIIEQIEESTPSNNALAQCPDMSKEFHKPSFLFVKAMKK